MQKSTVVAFFVIFLVVCFVQASEIYTAYSVETDYITRHHLVTTEFTCSSLTDCSDPIFLDLRIPERFFFELARNSQGEFFCIDVEYESLARLDVESGALQTVSPLQVDIVPDDEYMGMAFDREDQLWISSMATLHRIDLQDGSSIEEVSLESSLSSLAFHDGEAFGTWGEYIYRIDLENGSMTTVTEFDGPWADGWFQLLSSSGDSLWAVVGLVDEPGDSPVYQVHRVVLDDGEIIPIGGTPNWWYHQLGIEIVKKAPLAEPAVPGLGMLGSVVLVALLAMAGVVLMRNVR